MSAIEKAAEMLRHEAASIKACHTLDDDWCDDPAEDEYEEILATADAAIAERDALRAGKEALEREAVRLVEQADDIAADLTSARKELDALKAWKEEAEKQKPVFWYRPVCNGEMYEGPVHNSSVGGKLLRDEKPGEWVPLYAHSILPAHRSCNACNWQGPASECVMLGAVGPLCPNCRETTDTVESVWEAKQ